MTGNPTVVLVRPPLPLDQHLPFLTLKYLFYAKQSVVRQLHFLQIGVVKGAFHGGSIPLVNLVSGNGTGYHAMHDKHFLGPPGQIPFLEGTVHFVETPPIPHVKFQAGGFLFQPFAVQVFPHGFLVAPRHVLGSHANFPMTGGIVPFHESRQFLEELKGVGGRKIPIESFFQGSIKPFHQCCFGIPVRREMMDSHVLGSIVGTCGCRILCLDLFAVDWGDALGEGSCQRLGPRPPRSWLSRVGPTRTWTEHRPRSSGTAPRGCTWPRLAFPPNRQPIDRPTRPRSRANWQNGVVRVCARCKPNPVPRCIAFFSKATYEPWRIGAHLLNWLGCARRGIWRATWP